MGTRGVPPPTKPALQYLLRAAWAQMARGDATLITMSLSSHTSTTAKSVWGRSSSLILSMFGYLWRTCSKSDRSQSAQLLLSVPRDLFTCQGRL